VTAASKAEERLGGGKKESKSKKKRGKGARIRKAHNSGYIVHPEYESEPGEAPVQDEEHIHPDLASVMDHLKQHFGEEQQEGEKEPAAGQEQE
jgi:hypothetical protein